MEECGKTNPKVKSMTPQSCALRTERASWVPQFHVHHHLLVLFNSLQEAKVSSLSGHEALQPSPKTFEALG